MSHTPALAHRPLAEQIAALSGILRDIPALAALLDALPEGVWLGAGAVCQPVWNLAAGHPWRRGLKDIDVLFFDPDDLTGASEAALATRLAPHLPPELPPDVVNVARVHTWYEATFGRAIPPYPDIGASVATWPTFVSAVAVRGAITPADVIAPFGLADLFAGVVRPNTVLVSQAAYEAKVARWREWWPALDIHPWP